jgi:5-methylcytosine-specific restriction endonuclease McrA
MAAGGSVAFYASPQWKALRTACLERDRRCCFVHGCNAIATHADHIRARPRSPTLTPADRIDNLRSLCATHDAQVKEMASGARRRGGRFTVKGADAEGWPLEPSRR